MFTRSSQRSSISKEDDLLRCCARVSHDERTRDRFELLLRGPIDWPAFMCRCWWHRIRPLAYRHLRASASADDVVPPELWDQLSTHATEIATRNERLFRALNEVATWFEVQGIRMLVFKGPTLALDAYGDLSLRECGDLDLLVDRDDLPKVIELLTGHDFTLLESEFVEGGTRRPQQEFACEFQRDGISLDLHWDLVPGWLKYQVDFNRLWEDGRVLGNQGHYVRKLRPEDAMVVLCIHGTKHWWDRLRWICDIAELVNSQAITDWSRLEQAAANANSRRSVDLGLWLAANLLSSLLPTHVRRRLDGDPLVRKLGRQIEHWQDQRDLGNPSRNVWERFLFRMRACETTRDRVPQIVNYLLARSPRTITVGQ